MFDFSDRMIFINKRMMYTYHCDYCNKTYSFENRHQPGGHRRNCSLNPQKTSLQNKIQETKGLVRETFARVCPKCSADYTIKVTRNAYNKGHFPKFCSRKCANSRQWTAEDKEKRSLKARDAAKGRVRNTVSTVELRECEVCKGLFECKHASKKRFCGCRCVGSYRGRRSSQVVVKRSKQEIELFELVRRAYPEALSNKVIAEGWDADIVLEGYKIAVMWNGPWHYKSLNFKNHSLAQVQNRDRLKKRVFEKLGWRLFIFEDRNYTPKQAFEVVVNFIQSGVV